MTPVVAAKQQIARRPSTASGSSKEVLGHGVEEEQERPTARSVKRRPSLGESLVRVTRIVRRPSMARSEVGMEQPCSRGVMKRRPSLGESIVKTVDTAVRSLDKLSCITQTRKKKTWESNEGQPQESEMGYSVRHGHGESEGSLTTTATEMVETDTSSRNNNMSCSGLLSIPSLTNPGKGIDDGTEEEGDNNTDDITAEDNVGRFINDHTNDEEEGDDDDHNCDDGDDDDDEGSIDLNFDGPTDPFASAEKILDFSNDASPHRKPSSTIGSRFFPSGPGALAAMHASMPDFGRTEREWDDYYSPKSVLGTNDGKTSSETPRQRPRRGLKSVLGGSRRALFRNTSSRSLAKDEQPSQDTFSMSFSGPFLPSSSGDSLSSPVSTTSSKSPFSSGARSSLLATPVKSVRRRLRDMPGAPSLFGGSGCGDDGYESACSNCSGSSSGSVDGSGQGPKTTARVRRVKRSKSKVKAGALIDGIRVAIDTHTKSKNECERFILSQVTIAKARKSMGNDMGASLCMKKVKKAEAKRDRLDKAVQILERHLVGLEKEMEKAKAIAEAQLREGRKTSTKIVIDLQAHKNYAQEVEEALLEDPADQEELLNMSRQDLLNEMEEFHLTEV